ncbi:hypothetical protein Pmani_039178 [Petrolisthes manimaculis]|uniref:Uncharacterized protein n=1 Tax=Petrolisthes manimaculis TaxID=1843537 RepID=A0AAE1NEM8_9EUCA|nr:hypothetical protein Pmani_039178 [Petrolisthes manimaculis]
MPFHCHIFPYSPPPHPSFFSLLPPHTPPVPLHPSSATSNPSSATTHPSSATTPLLCHLQPLLCHLQPLAPLKSTLWNPNIWKVLLIHEVGHHKPRHTSASGHGRDKPHL